MREKRGIGSKIIFVISILAAILLAACVCRYLPATLAKWKQLVFFLTIIVVVTAVQIVKRILKR